MKTSVKFVKVNHPDVHTGAHTRDVVIQDEYGHLKSTLLLKLINEGVTARSLSVELVKDLLENHKAMKRKYGALKREYETLRHKYDKLQKTLDNLVRH